MALIEGAGGGRGPTGDVRQLAAALTQQKQYVPPWVRQALSDQGVIGQTSKVGQVVGKALNLTGAPQFAQGAIWSLTHPVQRLRQQGLAANPTMEVPWVAGRPWFHGSSHVFETPDVSRSARDSLYGPGHYVTDDPAIASTYAPKGSGGAPNVTRYGFEPDKVFDVREPVSQSVTARLVDALNQASKTASNDFGMKSRMLRTADELQAVSKNQSYALNALWHALEDRLGAARANDVLRSAGYDAIAYPGGAMTGGKAHNALVVLNQAPLRRGGAANPKYAGTPRPTR